MLGDLADACGRSSLFLMAASDAAEAIRTILRIQETKKQNKTKLQRNKRFLTSVIRYVHIMYSEVQPEAAAGGVL